MQALGIGRSTFQKLVTDEKVPKYRRSRDKKHYYRVEDIEALKNLPDEFHRVDGEDRAALAVAC